MDLYDAIANHQSDERPNTSCDMFRSSIRTNELTGAILYELLTYKWTCVSCFEFILKEISTLPNALDLINWTDTGSILSLASAKQTSDFTQLLLNYGACPLMFCNYGALVASTYAEMVNKEVLFEAITKHSTCTYCKEFVDYQRSDKYVPIFGKGRVRHFNSSYVALIAKYFDLDERYGDGSTLLYNCVRDIIDGYGNDLIPSLLEAGASIHITPNNGISLLELAQGNKKLYEFLLEYDIVIKEPDCE